MISIRIRSSRRGTRNTLFRIGSTWLLCFDLNCSLSTYLITGTGFRSSIIGSASTFIILDLLLDIKFGKWCQPITASWCTLDLSTKAITILIVAILGGSGSSGCICISSANLHSTTCSLPYFLSSLCLWYIVSTAWWTTITTGCRRSARSARSACCPASGCRNAGGRASRSRKSTNAVLEIAPNVQSKS